MKPSFYVRRGKRLFDVMIAGSALVLAAPLASILYILGKRSFGSALFYQERTGLHGNYFRLVKFRSMHDAFDPTGSSLPDAQRLTTYGRFLRKTSMDELPELFCVLQGTMSLVGPRPLLPRYDPYYTQQERVRFCARPGLVGLAQIGGRNALSWDARLAMDTEYVESISFRMDVRILLKAVKVVVTARGHVQDPTSTMLDLDAERRSL